MRSPDELTSLIIHGLGVEGKAALGWFLENSTASVIAIDGAVQFERLPSSIRENDRVCHLTEDLAVTALPELAADNPLYLRSPGVPPTNPVFEKVRELGLQHTTPTGYWLATQALGNVITITGTKGKSSTASLTAHLLRWAGRSAEELGNIGRTPFEAAIAPETICVVELSSYMMHDLPAFTHFHVVTSLYKEHTNWHGTHAAYRHDKLRPFLQSEPVPGLLPAALFPDIGTTSHTVHSLESLIAISDDTLTFSGHSINPAQLNDVFAAPSMLLAIRTAIAACLGANLLSASDIANALQTNLSKWRGLSSRQEIIPTSDGRLWVNDALATVPEATISALTRFRDSSIHLLLGGADRGQDFSALLTFCEQLADLKIYAFSEIVPRLQKQAAETGFKNTIETFDTLEDMISAAVAASSPHSTVLFSPAAPSAPPHANFTERAEIFRRCAQSQEKRDAN